MLTSVHLRTEGASTSAGTLGDPTAVYVVRGIRMFFRVIESAVNNIIMVNSYYNSECVYICGTISISEDNNIPFLQVKSVCASLKY